MDNSEQKYPISMRILHWLIAITILGLIIVGWWMSELPKDYPDRGFVYGLHKSFGVLVLILVTIRLVIRLKSFIPPTPKSLSVSVQRIVHTVHCSLYILMFSVPVLGYLTSNSFGYGVSIFGLPLPKVFPKNKEIGGLLDDWHAYLAYTMLVIVLLHIAGALKHRFLDKENDVLKRML